jgi:hypothetical protein
MIDSTPPARLAAREVGEQVGVLVALRNITVGVEPTI